MNKKIIFISIVIVLTPFAVYADCSFCSSEPNCSGKYILCEDFEDYVPGTDFWCDGSAPGGTSRWHDLIAFPDTSAGDCIRGYGIITSDKAYQGNYSFFSKVTSKAEGSSTGYDGGDIRIDGTGPVDEAWVRWYIYIPEQNYYTGSGFHCNHHAFLNDGAGAYPAIDLRHYFWQKDGVGNSDWKYGDDGKLYIGVHSFGSDTGGEFFQANGQTYQDGPPSFAISDHFDEWICLEWYVQQSTKRMKLWVNGIQVVDTGSTMTFSKSPTHGFQIGSYNCQNADVGTSWIMYIDNIAVSTEGYIGPLDVNPNNPPVIPDGINAREG